MRAVLDVARLLRSCLGFMGHYRVASAVGIAVAVGYILWHSGSGSYAHGLPDRVFHVGYLGVYDYGNGAHRG